MALSICTAPRIASTTARRAAGTASRASALLVRASAEQQQQQASASKQPAVINPHPAARISTFEEVMGFAGAAPEVVNGRLAQLGFLAAVGAELFTQKPVAAQLAGSFSTVAAILATFAAASLVPIIRGIKNDEAFGPFTPQAELVNGRWAMLGFAALIVIEAFKGSALF